MCVGAEEVVEVRLKASVEVISAVLVGVGVRAGVKARVRVRVGVKVGVKVEVGIRVPFDGKLSPLKVLKNEPDCFTDRV